MDKDVKSILERRVLSCSDVEELLDSYVDGEMAASMTPRFEQHLDGCEYCRILVADCQQLVSVARSLADAPIPQEISQRLREALRAKVGHETPNPPPPVKLTLVKSGQDN